MTRLEYYREKWTDSVRDGFKHERNSKNIPELLEGLKEKGKYNKVRAVARVIKEIAPDIFSQKVLDLLKEDYSQLPFDPEKLEFKEEPIGKGGEHQVYLLESTDPSIPSYVLKIHRKNKGNLEIVQQESAKFKNEYEKIKQRYAGVSGLVPEELTMIVANPKTGNPLMVTIQRYFGKEMRDLVNDFKEEKITGLLKENPDLRTDFRRFLEITDQENTRTGEVIDLLGDKNLSVVKVGDKHKLLIADPHSSVEKSKGDKRLKRNGEYLEKLKEFLREAEENESS